MPKTCSPLNAPSTLALAAALACGAAVAQPVAPAAPPAPAAAASAAAASAAAASAPAAPTSVTPRQAPALDRVEITGGGPSDSEARRQSTASKIVIGSDELDRMGDTSVADVLKRMPGVTIGGRPGRGGDIRMRGLGSGYTQIMINGERIPPGFSIDTLTPEQIERIEVSRAPTAETGARAIAGSINIVLREDVKRRLNNINLSLGDEAGQVQPGLSWTRGDQDGDLSYNLSASVYRNRRTDRSMVDTTTKDTATGVVTAEQHEERRSLERRVGVHLGGRVMWRLGAGENLSFMPFLLSSHSATDATGTHVQSVGTSLWDTSSNGSNLSFSLARATLQWTGRSGANRFELRGGLNRAISDSHGLRQEFGAQPQSLENTGLSGEGGWSSAGKINRSLGADHSVALGWEAEGQRRSESKVIVASPVDPQRPQTDLGDEILAARTLRRAVWAQDEWNLSPTWSAYAGLRWEAINVSSDPGESTSASSASTGSEASRLGNRSRVWTPLLHSVWKLDEASKDQIRFALTRSYRNPTLSNLVARPTPSLNNSATRPDRVGNPGLLPELATGLDLAYEHYFSAGGLASVSVFQRRIGNLIRTITTNQPRTVGGIVEDHWVAQPQNVGDASSSGIELEAKFRLAELMKEADGPVPNVDLRSNLSVYRSRVSGVDGPDNRLDQQPRASANLGADWKPRNTPLTVGAGYNWTPAGRITLSSNADVAGGSSQLATSSAKRVIDAYALWTFSPAVQLRLSAANLLAEDALSTSTVIDQAVTETSRTNATTWRVWTLRLELKL